MKNLLTRPLTAFVLGVLLLTGASYAQYAQRVIDVSVPFAFTVGGKTLPAGEYSIVRVAPDRLALRDSQARVLVSLITHSVESDSAPAASRLDFSTQDGGHVLTRVWLEHDRVGYELPRAHTATMIAKQHRGSVQTIVAGSQP